MPPREPRTLQSSERLLLLWGSLLLTVVGFAFYVAWRHGLLARVWQADPTGIAVAITLLFLAASAHGSVCLLRLCRALRHLARLERQVAADGAVFPGVLPDGCVGRYLRDLGARARLNGMGTVDLGLLLDAFEAELRQGQPFGQFIADLLLSLGLLGMVVGLVVLLDATGGLDAAGRSAVDALAASNGMAVVLYTALVGLLGGMLLKIQGAVLDRAANELVRRTARLTERQLLPAMQRIARDTAAV